MRELSIRDATAGDLSAINEIYNYYVASSTCTFQEDPDTLEDRRRWFAAHDKEHPVIVAQEGPEIAGWASLSSFHARCAYRHTVENSVYVRNDMHGKGIGKTLLWEIIRRGRQAGHHTLIAAICADQPVSIALHEKSGFVQAARLREVGFKFGRWLDVVYMQLMLGGAAEARGRQ